MTDDSELVELVRRGRAGDASALDLLSRQLQGWLSSVAREITRDPESSADLAQEAILRALKGLDSYDDSKPFMPWMFSIVRNLSLNHRRQKSKRPMGTEADPTAGPVDAALRLESGSRIREAVAGLPAPSREIVLLRYSEGLSLRMIAERLNVTEVNVRVRLHRALVQLRGELGESEVTS